MRIPLALERRPDDLIIANAISAAVIVAVFTLEDSPVRWILGLVFVLILPGYVTTAALFPSRERIDWIERGALSLGLSVAIVPLVGLMLNYSSAGIKLSSIAFSMGAYIALLSVIAYYRRMQLPEEERMRLEIYIDLDLRKYPIIDRVLIVTIVVVLIATVSLLVYAISSPGGGERFTQLALLNGDMTASDYPTGNNGTVIVCIGCNEGEDTDYTLVIALVAEESQNYTSLRYSESLEGYNAMEIGEGLAVNVTVVDGDWVNSSFSYEFDDAGVFKLRFLLYKQVEIDGAEPYREVYLWLTN